MNKIKRCFLKTWGLIKRVWISFRNWVSNHIIVSTIIALIMLITSIFLMVNGYG